MGILISEAALDENGMIGYEPHKTGDQNGNEVRTVPYYNYPWSHVYRCKNKDFANVIAIRQMQAAANDKIGYSQAERSTYMKYLLIANYDPSKITALCDVDCSALVNANVFVTLLSQGIKTNINGYETTSAMPGKYDNNEYFENVTAKVDLVTGKGLERGDILLKPGKHTAVVTTVDASLSTTPKWVGRVVNADFVPVYSDYEKTKRCDYPTLGRGNLIDVCDEKGSYYYIRIAAKYYGFVPKTNIENIAAPKKTGTVTTALYLRNGTIDKAGKLTTGAAIAVMPEGATVEILETVYTTYSAKWYKASWGGKAGYCSASYVKL